MGGGGGGGDGKAGKDGSGCYRGRGRETSVLEKGKVASMWLLSKQCDQAHSEYLLYDFMAEPDWQQQAPERKTGILFYITCTLKHLIQIVLKRAVGFLKLLQEGKPRCFQTATYESFEGLLCSCWILLRCCEVEYPELCENLSIPVCF